MAGSFQGRIVAQLERPPVKVFSMKFVGVPHPSIQLVSKDSVKSFLHEMLTLYQSVRVFSLNSLQYTEGAS